MTTNPADIAFDRRVIVATLLRDPEHQYLYRTNVHFRASIDQLATWAGLLLPGIVATLANEAVRAEEAVANLLAHVRDAPLNVGD